MKTNDRIRSEFNTGTVKKVENETVTIHWDGYAWPIDVSASLAATFDVVGSVDPYCGMISGDDDLDEPDADEMPWLKHCPPHEGIYSSND